MIRWYFVLQNASRLSAKIEMMNLSCKTFFTHARVSSTYPSESTPCLQLRHLAYRYITCKSKFLPTKRLLQPQRCLKYRIVLDVLRPGEVVTEVGDQVVKVEEVVGRVKKTKNDRQKLIKNI